MANYHVIVNRVGWAGIGLRAGGIWLLIGLIETIHGSVRIALLQPLIGDFRARQIAVFTGSILILAIAFLFRNRTGATRIAGHLAIGAIWVGLTIGFEILLGRVFLKLSWERLLSDYDVANGGLMLFGLAVMLSAPLIVSRFHTPDRPLKTFSH